MKKYLLVLGLPMAISGALLTGCSQQNGSTATTQTVAQNAAPENSSADEATEKGSDDHHADAASESKAHTHTTNLAFS
ncbi:MAG: hypothetical protein JWN98_2679, partial [Abditibacteriota bacterium]|nr:hypothetical protein [Abditibacteriota bacterium]